MNSIIYLLQVTACTAVFYLFYYLFLNRLTFFVTNRWYLLVTVMLSFAIPLIKIPVNEPHAYTGVVQQVVYTYTPQEVVPITITPATIKATPVHWGDILKFAYLAAVLALTIHLAITLIAFFRRMKGKRITKMGNVNILSSNEKITNGSFLNYIFLNDEELSADEIQQIIAHEMLHVRLYHSVDRIIVKIAQIILWFNPFIYLYARSVEENHEFEVDRAIARNTDKHNYANLLLHLSVAGQGMLYHNFSKVPLKKRISMLFNQPSANMKKIVYVLIVPVVLISCLAFARLKNNEISKYSVIEGIDNAGKNTAVLIDGKFFTKDILYKISKSCIKAAYITFPGESVDVKGKLYYNGVVVITTYKGGITYMDDLEKENLAIVRAAEKGKLYTRVTLKNEDGSVYDKVIISLMNANKFAYKISHTGKAGFIINNRVYNEEAYQKLTQSLSNFPYLAVEATDEKHFSRFSKMSNEIKKEITGYEVIFTFDVFSTLFKKSQQNIIDSTINAMMAYEKTDDYKRKTRLSDELYGKTIHVKVNHVINNAFVKDRIERVFFNYNGDNYFMSFFYGNTLKPKVILKPEDELTIKISTLLFGTKKADTLEIAPAEIYKDGELIFSSKDKTNPEGVVKNTTLPAEKLSGTDNHALSDEMAVKPQFFKRTHFQKSDVTGHDKVTFTLSDGSSGSANLGTNDKVGVFIDGKFYKESAILKLSTEKTSKLIFDNTRLGFDGYKMPKEDYAIPFKFKTKALATQADTVKYQQKGTPKNNPGRKAALEYINSPEGQVKSELCKEVMGKTINVTVKAIVPNSPQAVKLFTTTGGVLVDYNGKDLMIQTHYGQGKELARLLKKRDNITLKAHTANFRKGAPVFVEPAYVIRNNAKIYQLAEADKIPHYPFLYEANKVRFADGQISNIVKYANGKWKSALFETVNGYKFNLSFKQTSPELNSIASGDHVRLRFVHEVKTAAKAYSINDWVSISTDVKDYGIKNPEMFDKFYEMVNSNAGALTSKTDNILNAIKIIKTDSIKGTKDNMILLGNVRLRVGDCNITADYVRIDPNKQLMLAARRKNSNDHLPTMTNAHNEILCDSLAFNYNTQTTKVWNSRGLLTWPKK